MRTYALARYLTEPQRRRATLAAYVPTPDPHWPDRLSWRDAHGVCVLGRALGLSYSPPVAIAARLVAESFFHHPAEAGLFARSIVAAAVRELIVDWDEGTLTPADLPAALGLEGTQ